MPGSTMKHSEFLAGAKIQQFVAKYGAAITSNITPKPRLSASSALVALDWLGPLLNLRGFRVPLSPLQQTSKA